MIVKHTMIWILFSRILCMVIVTPVYCQPPHTEFSISRCNEERFDIQLCPFPAGISVSEAKYRRRARATSEVTCPEAGQSTCYADIMDENSPYYEEILHKCTGMSCTNLKAIKYSVDNWQDCTNWFDSSDYVQIQYTCESGWNTTHLFKTGVCNDGVFPETMCLSQNYKIHILHAFFGDIGIFQQCNNDTITEFDYRVNIQDVDPGYYLTEINGKCEGKPGCKDLVAKNYTSDRFGEWNYCTEYVMLVYYCVPVPEYSTSTRQPPTLTSDAPTLTSHTPTLTSDTSSDIPSVVTTSSTNVTWNPNNDKNNMPLGVIIGVSVAAVILVVIIVVIVMVVIIKRRKTSGPSKPHPTGSNNTTGQGQEMTYVNNTDYAEAIPYKDQSRSFDEKPSVNGVKGPSVYDNIGDDLEVEDNAFYESAQQTQDPDDTVLVDNVLYSAQANNEHINISQDLYSMPNKNIAGHDPDDLELVDNECYSASPDVDTTESQDVYSVPQKNTVSGEDIMIDNIMCASH